MDNDKENENKNNESKLIYFIIVTLISTSLSIAKIMLHVASFKLEGYVDFKHIPTTVLITACSVWCIRATIKIYIYEKRLKNQNEDNEVIRNK